MTNGLVHQVLWLLVLRRKRAAISSGIGEPRRSVCFVIPRPEKASPSHSVKRTFGSVTAPEGPARPLRRAPAR
jgi:hypothetical protein